MPLFKFRKEKKFLNITFGSSFSNNFYLFKTHKAIKRLRDVHYFGKKTTSDVLWGAKYVPGIRTSLHIPKVF